MTECIDGLCPIEQKIIPKYIKTLDKSVLEIEVPVEQTNAYSDELVRARDENGKFIADDMDTEENEAFTPRKKTLKEFTYTEVLGDVVFIQVTGGYTPNKCFSNRKFPVTDELLDWYLSLGESTNVEELFKQRSLLAEGNECTIY